jgi:hypothetical protein
MDTACEGDVCVAAREGIPVACVLLFPPEEDALADTRLHGTHAGQTWARATPHLQDVQLGSGVRGFWKGEVGKCTWAISSMRCSPSGLSSLKTSRLCGILWFLSNDPSIKRSSWGNAPPFSPGGGLVAIPCRIWGGCGITAPGSTGRGGVAGCGIPAGKGSP